MNAIAVRTPWLASMACAAAVVLMMLALASELAGMHLPSTVTRLPIQHAAWCPRRI